MKTIFTLILILFIQILLAQDKMFTITATAENISGHRLVIDHPLLNENFSAAVIANYNTSPMAHRQEKKIRFQINLFSLPTLDFTINGLSLSKI